MCMDPAASMHPVSVLRHSKGSGRATYLTPTQDALAEGTPIAVKPFGALACDKMGSVGEFW